LRNSLKIIEDGIQSHFGREENRLLHIFEQHGSEMLAAGLRVLLLEHSEILGRISKSKKDVSELTAEKTSREIQQARAWGVRVYISHTRKLLLAHAQSEQELFYTLRSELTKARKKG